MAQGTITQRTSSGLDGMRAVALAVVLAIAVIAAVALVAAFAPGGPLAANSVGIPAGVTIPDLDRRENAPQR